MPAVHASSAAFPCRVTGRPLTSTDVRGSDRRVGADEIGTDAADAITG
ncbi:hypothetical protein [Actinomycetospora atypica]|uniref:Uncharacterized protein n=1 Tax=Actinomycetospora atypica TaxID=1290095 RepID=A0ABV9YNZ3_9PSEU